MHGKNIDKPLPRLHLRVAQDNLFTVPPAKQNQKGDIRMHKADRSSVWSEAISRFREHDSGSYNP